MNELLYLGLGIIVALVVIVLAIGVSGAICGCMLSSQISEARRRAGLEDD